MVDNAKEEFNKYSKRILQTRVSTNTLTLIRHKKEIIAAYTLYVRAAENEYILLTEADKTKKQSILDGLNAISDKFIQCLINLNCSFNLSANLFDVPDPDSIKIIGIEINREPEQPSQIETHSSDIERSPSVSPEPIPIEMERPEFLKICASTINKPYDGTPIKLNAFLNSIELLEDVAGTTATLTECLVRFIKARLEEAALEHVEPSSNTIAAIKNDLKKGIKPENSTVISGKLAALHADRHGLQDFAKQAEALADDFRRSLIMEGIPAKKAKELAVKETIDLCRKNARSDVTKSVLESSKFETPQEAVASYVIQTTKAQSEYKDRSVLSFRKTQRKPVFNNRGNKSFQKYRNNNRNFNYQAPSQSGQQANSSRGRQQHNNSRRGSHSNQNYGNNANRRYIRTFYNSSNQGNAEGPAPSTSEAELGYELH